MRGPSTSSSRGPAATSRRRGALVALALALVAAGGAGAEPVGKLAKVEGAVLVRPDAGEGFAPGTVGQVLHRGGAVVVMEGAAATLDLGARGKVELADNAALDLAQALAAGQFSTVTGVRAPVLFLHPTGDSDPYVEGALRVTLGINHDLDKVRGVTEFSLYALHEDDEYDLDPDAGVGAVLEVATELTSFQAKPVGGGRSGYTWYDLEVAEPPEDEGDYTLFVVARAGEAPVRLGQSSLLLVELPEDL